MLPSRSILCLSLCLYDRRVAEGGILRALSIELYLYGLRALVQATSQPMRGKPGGTWTNESGALCLVYRAPDQAPGDQSEHSVRVEPLPLGQAVPAPLTDVPHHNTTSEDF